MREVGGESWQVALKCIRLSVLGAVIHGERFSEVGRHPAEPPRHRSPRHSRGPVLYPGNKNQPGDALDERIDAYFAFLGDHGVSFPMAGDDALCDLQGSLLDRSAL